MSNTLTLTLFWLAVLVAGIFLFYRFVTAGSRLRTWREEFKNLKWALYLVVFAFIVLIFVDWGSGKLSGRLPGNQVIGVGKESISLRKFQLTYRNMVDQYRSLFKEQFDAEMIKKINLPQLVANQLINRELLAIEAEKAGFHVSKEDIRQEILSKDIFKDEQGNFIGAERYQQLLKANQLTVAEFEEDMRKDILIRRFRRFLESTFEIPEGVVVEEYKKRNWQGKTDYLLIPDSTFFSQVQVTDEEAEAYYQQHQKEYEHPEKRKVSYLLADVNRLGTTLLISDKELKDYYDTHQEDFPQEEQIRARHILIKVQPEKRTEAEALAFIQKIRQEIEKGKPFEEAAKAYSEDPGSKDRGGDLGYFGRGRMVKPFEEVAFSLEKGVLSEPVKTSYGYHLIQVLDHKPAGIKPFEEVKFIIRNKIVRKRAEKVAEEKIQQTYQALKDKEKVTAEDLRNIADEDPDLSYNISDWFSRDDTVPGIGKEEAFMSTVFSMETGTLSVPLKIPRGWICLRLEGILPKGLSPFEEVKGEIVKIIKEERAHKKAQEQILLRLQEIQSLKDLAKTWNLQVKEDQTIRYLSLIPGVGSLRHVHEALFSAPLKQITDPIETPKGWILFYVKEKPSWDEEAYQKAKESLVKTLRTQKVEAYLKGLLNYARKKTRIVVNQAFLDSLIS